jgi:hypothetical protein
MWIHINIIHIPSKHSLEQKLRDGQSDLHLTYKHVNICIYIYMYTYMCTPILYICLHINIIHICVYIHVYLYI